MQKSTVCVVGLGYIGLPSAALLASCGHVVSGVDVNERVVETINRGDIHIVEPDLDAFVRSAVAAGRLKAYTRPQPANIFMVCVPTPFHEGGVIPQPNIDYVLAAAKSIAGLLRPGNLVILESTSPVGTTARLAELLEDEGVDISALHIAYCPERVLPGKIMAELVQNDRVVGGLTPAAAKAIADFYRSFVSGEVLETDAATAEMCKLTENSYRDVNIAFANELSLICAKEGIDVWRLIKLANRHPRVNILQPGPGVGGHCIAVDPWFIVARDPENTRMIRSAREVNNDKTEWVIAQIESAIAAFSEKNGKPPLVACLGLAFKPDIDDLRESPALQIAQVLRSQGHKLITVEPNIEKHDEFDIIDLERALDIAELAVVLVKHRQFLAPQIKIMLREIQTLDFCGISAAES
jgi:UDP-N-acetyl-D-mannosaminuronic acid dehydrogenase